MTNNLPLKSLGDVCDFVRGPFGGSLKKEVFVKEGFAVYEQQHAIYNQFHDIRYFIDEKKFDEMKRFELKPGDLIMSCSGTMGKVAVVPDSINKGIINQALLKLTPKEGLLKEYLKYWMESEDFKESIAKHSKGAAIKNVASVQILKSILLPYPGEVTQQQIVCVLDKVFATIDQAKTNIERNLQNARELFQSELNRIFREKGQDWIKMKLKDIGRTQTGNTPPTNDLSNYGNFIPFVKPAHFNPDGSINYEETGLSEKGLKTSRLFDANSVLMVCIGATIGKTAFSPVPVASNQQVNSLTPNDSYEAKLFYYAMTTDDFFKQVIDNSAQATLPIINKSKWENLSVIFPKNKENQKALVNRLEQLSIYTRELEQMYLTKLNYFESLKKSILHKAFSGQLRKNSKQVTQSITIAALSITDLHAGIIALSLQKHEQANTQNTFHHVKSEKIAHMVEAHLKIDLGRSPIKDAAGPNDYPLKMKVESRAKKAGFFYVEQSGEMKNYSKGSQFDKLIEKTSNALGDHLNDVCNLIDVMARMSTQQAEIVATVYAAWNNLLIDKADITDEAIVREARENWHPQKLKIERERFFKAITWMREHDLIPTGSGKRVNKKS
jgi:type I restriction enzyme S subunit